MSPHSFIDHNGYVVGDLFYLASYTGGLRILDLKNIESKEVNEKYYFDTFIEQEVVGGTKEPLFVLATDLRLQWPLA